MASTTLYHVIESEVQNNDILNPFNDLFDRSALLNTIDSIIKSKYESNVEYDSDGIKLVSALSELNKIYEKQVSEIKDLLLKTGLTSLELVEGVVAATNFHYMDLLDQQRNWQNNIDNSRLDDINNITKGDFKNVNGASVSATDIADSLNDAANEVITIALKLNITTIAEVPLQKGTIASILTNAMHIASVLYGMKSSFLDFKFETASISYESDTIVFKKSPGTYYAVKTANKLRRQNQILEIFSTALRFPDQPIYKPVHNLSGGKIEFLKGNETENSNKEVICEFLAFHFHLHLAKLEGFGDYRVNDLFSLFEHLRMFFHSFEYKKIIVRTVESQDFHDIPYKIDVNHLTSFLVEQSGFSTELARSFISLLCQPLGQDMDIWARPFMRVNDELLFLLGTVGGHLTYQFENLIDHFVSRNEQLKLFKNYLQIELEMVGHTKTFKKVDISSVSTRLTTTGLLVYETLKHLIVLDLCVIRYPLEPELTAAQMMELFRRSEVLKANIQIIKENLKQLIGKDQLKIVGVVVTNHPVFSGLTLDKIPVMDATLLKNYLDVGKYRRAIMVSSPENIDSDEISSYPYYHNDESFDGNILSFVYQPAPVYEMLKNLQLKDFKLSVGTQTPLVFVQNVELQPLSQSMSGLVFELSEYLNQLYYFNADYDKDPEGKQLLMDRIEFLTPLTFSYFAIDKTDRKSRMVLLSKFKKVGFDGMVFLVNNLLRSSRQIARKGVVLPAESVWPPIDHIKAEKQWDEISKVESFSGPISPSNFILQHNLSNEDRNNLIRHLLSLGVAFAPGTYSEERINHFYVLVTVTAGLARGLDQFEKDVYTLFVNLSDLLNYNGYFQKARDLGEEALAYSFKYEQVPLLGWLVLFKCYTRQKNVHDAAYYGNAYFAALNALPKIQLHQTFDGFYNGMLFFRNFGFRDIADNFFESLKSMPLDPYQRQQITLSFLNSKLGDVKHLQQHIQLAEDFLNTHILEITENGQQGALPWLAFIYNLINIETGGEITVPASLNVYLTQFESLIDDVTLENIRSQFFPNGEKSVIILKEALTKTYETRSLEDYVSEITALEILANNVVSISISPLNLNNLLICGLVINDQTLAFQAITIETEQIPISQGHTSKPNFDTYGSEILNKIPLQTGQLLIWLFEFRNQVSALCISESRQTVVVQMSEWSLENMRKWLGNLDNFFFDEKNGYPINQQEADYIDDLRNLAFARLNIPFPYNEILIGYSLDLASFPPNLLQVSTEGLTDETIKLHEERVRDHISEESFDFIGFHKPITNIISIEYFASKKIFTPKVSEINVSCWIPTFDDDMTLHIAENTLRPIIEEKYHSTIQTSIYPKPALNSMINVFVAHGAKSITGFKSVHTRGQTEGHAIINETGISRVFGTGFIAVVFICDSGSMTKDIYNQKLISFVSEILSLGYQAVVAPAWKYNPAITAVWLDTFMESLKKSQTISFAVQTANQTAAKEGFDEHFGFYSPRGWAAMHLYGNPNICFISDEVTLNK